MFLLGAKEVVRLKLTLFHAEAQDDSCQLCLEAYHHDFLHGGFKDLTIFTPKIGEMIQFDSIIYIFFEMGCSTTN